MQDTFFFFSRLSDDNKTRGDVPWPAVAVLVVAVELPARHVTHVQCRRSCQGSGMFRGVFRTSAHGKVLLSTSQK